MQETRSPGVAAPRFSPLTRDSPIAAVRYRRDGKIGRRMLKKKGGSPCEPPRNAGPIGPAARSAGEAVDRASLSRPALPLMGYSGCGVEAVLGVRSGQATLGCSPVKVLIVSSLIGGVAAPALTAVKNARDLVSDPLGLAPPNEVRATVSDPEGLTPTPGAPP
jgi:hypothetical protein